MAGRARFGVASLAACSLTAALFGAGCTSELTEIVVVVDTDLRAPDEVDEIRVTATGAQDVPKTARTALGPGTTLPVTLGLVPRAGGAGPVTIRAVARRAGADVVATEVRTSFVSGRRLVVRMTLLSTCVPVAPTCRAGETCRDGRCVASAVDPSTLPGFDGDVSRVVDAGAADLGEPADGAVDAGHDAGGSDAAVDDAGGGVDGGGATDGGHDAGPTGCRIAADCDDRDPCTDDACDTATGACVRTFNTAPCDDGNACTSGERCASGACGGGMPLLCLSTPCMSATCDPALGCVSTRVRDGAACDRDGNDRTCDVCVGGVCSGSTVCGVGCVCAYGGPAPTCTGPGVCEVMIE